LVACIVTVVTGACTRTSVVPSQPTGANVAMPSAPAQTQTPPPATKFELIVPTADTEQFPTPEAAIAYFIDALKDNRFYDSLKAFALKERVIKGSYESRMKFVGVVFDPLDLLPSSYNEYNSALALTSALGTYRTAILTLLGVDPVLWKMPSGENDDADLAAFMDEVNPEKLRSTRIVSATNLNATMNAMEKERFDATNAKFAQAVGADQRVMYKLVLARASHMVQCDTLTLVRYGKNWKILGGIFHVVK